MNFRLYCTYSKRVELCFVNTLKRSIPPDCMLLAISSQQAKVLSGPVYVRFQFALLMNDAVSRMTCSASTVVNRRAPAAAAAADAFV